MDPKGGFGKGCPNQICSPVFNGKSGVSRDICALSFRERTPELEIFTSDKGMTGNQRTEDRGQKTEDRGQRTEVRGQRTGDRGQKSEVRGQGTEDRGQKSEVRGQRPEDRGQKTEGGN